MEKTKISPRQRQSFTSHTRMEYNIRCRAHHSCSEVKELIKSTCWYKTEWKEEILRKHGFMDKSEKQMIRTFQTFKNKIIYIKICSLAYLPELQLPIHKKQNNKERIVYSTEARMESERSKRMS